MRRSDAQEILGRLVACPSIAGGGNQDLITEIADQLDHAGANVRVFEAPRPRAQMLHAVIGPATAPGGVLLAAHGDVVDVHDQAWSSDPFVLRAEAGRLYGRGTADMKGFIAATLAAVQSTNTHSLNAPIHIAISHDEELGCVGVPILLDMLADAGAIPGPLAGVVVGEPTELRVVDRHKGKVAFEITIRGAAAHSATPNLGVNAVNGAAHLIVAFEALERELANETTDEAFGVPHATVGIGTIAGGVALNIVPDRCSVQVEARLLPGQSPRATADRFERLCSQIGETLTARAARAGIDITPVADYPPLAPHDADAPFAARIAELSCQAFGGAVDFGTEAGVYQERLQVPVVVCGPGSMVQGHVADEFLEADQLAQAQDLVAGLVRQLSI